jgi:hypothetical protein
MADVKMSGVGLEKSNSQGGRINQKDMQTLMAMMNQILQLLLEQRTEAKQMEERLKEGQENFKQGSKQDLIKVTQESEQRLREGQREISVNYQRSQEKMKQELGEKITTEVGKVVTKVKKVREEIANCHNETEQEMSEENSLVEVSISDISGRLREQLSKTKQDNVIEKLDIQGDNCLMGQEVKVE